MNQRLIQEGTALPLTYPLKVDFNHKCHLVLESTQGDFGKELVVLLIIPFNFFVSLWCLWRFKQKIIYIGSLGVTLNLACQEVLFIQVQQLPPRMHHNCEKIVVIVCKTINRK